MKMMKQDKLEYFTKQQILRMNQKTRRMFILRMQLKNSLDIAQLARKCSLIIKPFPLLLVINVVTLILVVVLF